MLHLIASRSATAEVLNPLNDLVEAAFSRAARSLSVVSKSATHTARQNPTVTDFAPEAWRADALKQILGCNSSLSFRTKNGRREITLQKNVSTHGYSISCVDSASPSLIKSMECAESGNIISAQVFNSRSETTHVLNNGDLARRLMQFEIDQAIVSFR